MEARGQKRQRTPEAGDRSGGKRASHFSQSLNLDLHFSDREISREPKAQAFPMVRGTWGRISMIKVVQ
jgi:hypothetical protein